MKRRLGAAALALAVVAALGASSSHHRAATTVGPGVPSGYTQTYTRDFAHTAGLGDWVVQPGAGATVFSSTASGAQFGMGIKVTSSDQWAEVISSNAVITQNAFVKALVYIPAASGKSGNGTVFPAGSTANWPAWWTFGNPWPANGEIDALEGQTGQSCEQTHYGTNGEINSPSNCHQGNGTGTGWTEVTFWRTGQHVQVWYGNTYVGQVPLPTTANEQLVFQNQSYSASGGCPECFGPSLWPSTAWLSNVTVYKG